MSLCEFQKAMYVCPILFLTLAVGHAHSATITLSAVSDGTQYRQAQPVFPTQISLNTTNPTLTAKLNGSTAPIGTTTFTYQFAMEFNVSVVPTGWSIIAATLQWSEISDTLFDLNTHPLQGFIGNGTVATSDFSTGVTTVALGDVANGTVDTLKSIDVTSFIGTLHGNGDDYAGFRVMNENPFETPAGSFTLFEVGEYSIHGRLASNAELRPKLILTVVPEANAATMLCAAIAIVGLIGVVIRRHAH